DVRLAVPGHVGGQRPVTRHLHLELIVVDFMVAARETRPGPSQHDCPHHCHRHHTTSHIRPPAAVSYRRPNGEYRRRYTGPVRVSCNGLPSRAAFLYHFPESPLPQCHPLRFSFSSPSGSSS